VSASVLVGSGLHLKCREKKMIFMREFNGFSVHPESGWGRFFASLPTELCMSRFLDQIFSCRRDQYTGYPPAALLEKCSIPANAFDQDELQRAVWLWTRRPGDLFFDGNRVLWGRLGLFLVSIFFLVTFDIPGLLVAAALSFGVALFMLRNFYRRELWKRDYEASLFRLVRPYLR
jgi:hypothetical protein